MEVAGARRFCHACRKHVYDLSAMSEAEAGALLRGGRPVCVRYVAEVDGTLRFRDLVPRASLTRKLVRTALAASALAACAPHGEGTEVPGLDDDPRPSLSTDRVVRPDRREPGGTLADAPVRAPQPGPDDPTSPDSCQPPATPRRSAPDPWTRRLALTGEVVADLPDEAERSERRRLLELERRAAEQADD